MQVEKEYTEPRELGVLTSLEAVTTRRKGAGAGSGRKARDEERPCRLTVHLNHAMLSWHTEDTW